MERGPWAVGSMDAGVGAGAVPILRPSPPSTTSRTRVSARAACGAVPCTAGALAVASQPPPPGCRALGPLQAQRCPLFPRQSSSARDGALAPSDRDSPFARRHSNRTNTQTLLCPPRPSRSICATAGGSRPPRPPSAQSRGNSTSRLAFGTRRRQSLCLAAPCHFGRGATRQSQIGAGPVPQTSQLAPLGVTLSRTWLPSASCALLLSSRPHAAPKRPGPARRTGELVTPARKHSLSP